MFLAAAIGVAGGNYWFLLCPRDGCYVPRLSCFQRQAVDYLWTG
ncbi:hypothetical protein ABT202_29055 [Streptomyces sp900105245]